MFAFLLIGGFRLLVDQFQFHQQVGQRLRVCFLVVYAVREGVKIRVDLVVDPVAPEAHELLAAFWQFLAGQLFADHEPDRFRKRCVLADIYPGVAEGVAFFFQRCAKVVGNPRHHTAAERFAANPFERFEYCTRVFTLRRARRV